MEQINEVLTLKLRIDWSEQDYFGHVNNVSFFKYIQSARVNYWEHIGLYQFHRENRIGPMLASSKCDFRHPLYYPGELEIKTGIAHIGTTSFSLKHRLIDANGNLCAEAEDVMVMFDFNTNTKISIPERFRSQMKTE